MKKILDKILSPQIFAVAYLPWLAVNMVTVINILAFTRVILIAFAAWAVAIAVKMYFFGGKSAWTHKGMAILLVFLAMCLLTQLLQFSFGGLDALGKLCYFAVCLLVLYAQHGENVAAYTRTLRALAIGLGLVILILVAVSDWMFFELYSARITIRSGATTYLGFAENRLFGVFSSPNVGGSYALILVWCGAMLWRWSKEMRGKIAWRILAAVEMAVAVIFISVALSRGTYVSGAVMVVSYMLVRVPFAKEQLLARWKQWLIRAVSAAAALAVSVALINVVNYASCRVMEWNVTRRVAQEEPIMPSTAAVSVRAPLLPVAGQLDDATQGIIDNAYLGSSGREDVGAGKDISNNRFEIWRVHWSLLDGKHYLIGLNNPVRYIETAMEAGSEFTEHQQIIIRHANNNMHNGFMQMMINGGLLVLVPMLVFLVYCAVRACRYMGGTQLTGRWSMDTPAYALFSVTLPMVLTFLVNNLFETNFVLMGANVFQAFFWLMAGACMQSIREGATK